MRNADPPPRQTHAAANPDTGRTAIGTPRTTEVRKTLRPGQKGTGTFVRDWGERLVCVRYRFDPVNGVRFTTVEIVASEVLPWRPPHRPHPDALVWLRVRADEWKTIRRLRQERAWWDAERKLWRARYEAVERLKLRRRILKKGPHPRQAPTPNHRPVVTSRNPVQNSPGSSYP